MNSYNSKNIKVVDHRKLLRKAKSLYRKNRLHETITILAKMKHHGYDNDEVNLLLARVYDRLAYLTSDAEYEDAALDRYEDIIKYSGSRKYRKRAGKLRDSFTKRISLLNENDRKARNRAVEMKDGHQKSPKAWFMLGSNFPIHKDPMFVINAYKNAVKLNDRYILALFRLGYLYHHKLNEPDTATGFYLRLIKIDPHEDTVEPEAINVKAIIEGCSELSDIYIQKKEMNKVISVFDHAVSIFRTYSDICTPHDLKRIIKNCYQASLSLDNLPALKKHVLNKHNIDLEMISSELGIDID